MVPVTEPDWLDEQEMDTWLQIVRVLTRLPYALDAQLVRDAGLRHFDFQVLTQLSQAPARTLRMHELAAQVSASSSRIAHVVDRLEGHGWVHREPCAEDGRFTNATLTDEGWRKVVETAPGHVATVRRLVIDTMSREELAQVGSIGRRILQALDSPPPDARPTGTRRSR